MNDIEENKQGNDTAFQKEDLQNDRNPLHDGGEAPSDAKQNEVSEGEPVKPFWNNIAVGQGFINRFFEGILEKMRSMLKKEFFDFGSKLALSIGSAAFIVMGVIAAFASIVLGIRADSAVMTLLGILIAPAACLVFSFIGGKLFGSTTKLIEKFPSRFSSRAFLDSVAILCLFLGAASVVVAIVWGISARSWDALAIWLVFSVMSSFVGMMALSPKIVNSEIVEGCSTAEEFIGLVSFKIKALMLMAPFVWCVGAIVIVIGLLLAMINGDYGGAFRMTGFGLFIGLIPICIYVWFLTFALIVDILRAILSIPSKLDALKK